jgi:hypothetical protein
LHREKHYLIVSNVFLALKIKKTPGMTIFMIFPEDPEVKNLAL